MKLRMDQISVPDKIHFPRNQNVIVDALVVSRSVFEIPINSNKKYEIEVKHKPFVPDNVKY